ncbi:unnamed protein product [Toxocara canis]|uniref:Uncharacterized protein n=1 Tax=Toxocara canis TaxID=6265 RepID=A0A183VC16_TOXCA|nr:unnamed protein product [Toxocara canis]
MIVNVCASSVSHDASPNYIVSQNYYFTDEPAVSDVSGGQSVKESMADTSAAVVVSKKATSPKRKNSSVPLKIFKTIRNLIADRVKN